MTRIWKKKTQKEIEQRIFAALEQNINYNDHLAFGIPASHLDEKVFSQDESFLKNAPFISSLVQNPNHIGCHTLGKSESFFHGTQAVEKELIDICAIDILKGDPESHDGYVTSGGTEANLQAIWIYRNYFIQELNATSNEIGILCSEDSHYSMDKAGNLLGLDIYKVEVDAESREISEEKVEMSLKEALKHGKRHFIVVCNMMTTMFGSLDDPNHYTNVLKRSGCNFKIHVDGAFGGFYFPFTGEHPGLSFQNSHIDSFTLDAHKMAQAPYGTGIFFNTKGIHTLCQYPTGELCGRRRLHTHWKPVRCQCRCSLDGPDEKRILWLARKDFYSATENSMVVRTIASTGCQVLQTSQVQYHYHSKRRHSYRNCAPLWIGAG